MFDPYIAYLCIYLNDKLINHLCDELHTIKPEGQWSYKRSSEIWDVT